MQIVMLHIWQNIYFKQLQVAQEQKSVKIATKQIIRKLPLVSIDVNVILENDLRCIQQSIQKAVFTHGTCQTCKAN